MAGLMLAQGDRRDCLIIVDQTGGHHALNKKLTAHWGMADPAAVEGTDGQMPPGVPRGLPLAETRIKLFVALPIEVARGTTAPRRTVACNPVLGARKGSRPEAH